MYFSYITRPIWDSQSETWKTIIPRYDAEGLTQGQLCKLHGWTVRSNSSSPVRIIDAFLFSIELDLLEIRLHELYNVVDKFVILESDYTFTGKQKELIFQQNKERFKFAEDKIVSDAFKGGPLREKESPFDQERRMRIHMNALIISAGAQANDWVIMSDVDEIPSAHTVMLWKQCDSIPTRMHLQMPNYLYSFEFPLPFDPGQWRATIQQFHFGLGYSHSQVSDIILANAGWHCSFCFKKLSDFQFKMISYSHADRVHHDWYLDKNRIQKIICEGTDIFGFLPEAFTFKALFASWGSPPKATSAVCLPSYLIQNSEQFKFLLPGGCIREE